MCMCSKAPPPSHALEARGWQAMVALKAAVSSLYGCQVLPVPDEWALSSPDALPIFCEHLACRHRGHNAVV